MLSLDCDVVGSVSDGNPVLEATQRLQPDVVVVDLNLPKVHGLKACRQIKQITQIQRSSCSRRSMIRTSATIRRGGASAFVSKGAGDGDLLSTVKRLCDDKLDWDPNVIRHACARAEDATRDYSRRTLAYPQTSCSRKSTPLA